uniref:Uncharacterized protein n=1 Tax=Schistosoma haematobium TaxID=6185 RepID=A0A094ZHD5_SCHHA
MENTLLGLYPNTALFLLNVTNKLKKKHFRSPGCLFYYQGTCIIDFLFSRANPIYHQTSLKPIDHSNIDMSGSSSTVICSLTTTPVIITDSVNSVSIKSSVNNTTNSIMNITSSSTGISTDTYTSMVNLPFNDSLVCRSHSHLPTCTMNSSGFIDLTQKATFITFFWNISLLRLSYD